MFTRGHVAHQYGSPGPADYSPPPFHCTMHPHQYPADSALALQHGRSGGLRGGAVVLTARGFSGMRRGDTGYGYLGMDPSDPSSWIVRKFVPSSGMISYLNFGALV
jgi:hypothetical protein